MVRRWRKGRGGEDGEVRFLLHMTPSGNLVFVFQQYLTGKITRVGMGRRVVASWLLHPCPDGYYSPPPLPTYDAVINLY